jgi:hypothetical protein
VSNFMDYVDDACMDHFTNGQFAGMQYVWNAYRSPDAHGTDTDTTVHHDSPAVQFMHTSGLYYVIGSVVGLMGLVAGVMYKNKKGKEACLFPCNSDWYFYV